MIEKYEADEIVFVNVKDGIEKKEVLARIIDLHPYGVRYGTDVLSTTAKVEFLNGQINWLSMQDIRKAEKNEMIDYLSKNLFAPLAKLDLGIASDKHNPQAQEIFTTLSKIIRNQ